MAQKWDRIFDLGRGSNVAYERWGRKFGCSATAVDALRDGFREVRHVGEILAQGNGLLLDREGLDWWELTAIFFHHVLENIAVLQKLASQFTSADQVWISRPCEQGDALGVTLGRPVQIYQATRPRKGLGRIARALARLPLRQSVEVFWDKYDAGYGIRRLFTRQRAPAKKPVVLLPSAYGNVSRTGVGYARAAPDLNFLLVATRRSGWLDNLPANVNASWLAAYGKGRTSTRKELAELLGRWRAVRPGLEKIEEIGVLGRLGMLDRFPSYFAKGLAVRDAWLRVLEREPVQAVLCADDSNPHTHIPLLLAKARGLPTVACHHGALDGRHLFKRNHADKILAKGTMERDYLVGTCGVAEAEVEIGAPAEVLDTRDSRHREASAIVFFSEAYETLAGRAEEFYRDVLPPLADVAQQAGKRLVVKLHPAESVWERGRMVRRVLTAQQRKVTELVSGPLHAELLRQAWVGVTILSTVAMECTRLGIACFLCEWLDYGPYGYVEQFLRFGVGYGFKSSSDLQRIPEIMKTWQVRAEVLGNAWDPIRSVRLKELLSLKNERNEAAVSSRVGG